jgi:hypothetical protein
MAGMILVMVLTACQGINTQNGQQAALNDAVAKTLTAAPTITPTPSITPTLLPTLTPTQAVVQYGPTGFPENVDPLTGLTVADPAILNRRPIMIKVSNYPREGRPHAGLSFADIVFDYYTGEGSNRFLALFYGQDATQVGPIRSGRLVDRWLVSMYQGVLGLEYAWAPVYSEILGYLGSSRTISGGPNTCPAICSITTPQTVTSVFANTAELSKYYAKKNNATNTRQNLDGMAFNTIPPEGGVDGTEFTMQFSSKNLGNWKYDPQTKKYLRWIEDIESDGDVALVPLTDRITNQQLQFSNVIVIFAEIESLADTDTLHEIHIADKKKGDAIIFRDGKKYEVTYKSGHDVPIQFFDASGNPFELQPGNTWIHITGLSSTTLDEGSGVWRVKLGVP